jgi:hypothetical protein
MGQQRSASSQLRHAATGPRTAAGKMRSRRNAHRHGLAIPVCLDPTVSAKVEKIARQIAGSSASEAVMRLARQAAEAQVDIIRCRQTRCRILEAAPTEEGNLLEDALGDPYLRRYLLKTMWRQSDLGLPEGLGSIPPERLIAIDRYRGRAAIRRNRAHTEKLIAIDRYECRALSRRNRALQDLDCQRIIESVEGRPCQQRASE